MSSVTLPSTVNQCFDAFDSLREAAEAGSEISLALQEERGRFKVWTANISAHRAVTSRRSLEYRLRDSSNLRDTVNFLLQDLLQALQALADVAPSSHDLNSAVEAGENAFVDEDDDFDFGPGAFTTEDEEQRLLEDIHDVVNCLMRFSMTLRNPARHDHMRYSATSNAHHYEPFDREHVRSKYPEAPDYLVERLGKSISRHRLYFDYREQHHAKLAEGLEHRVNQGEGTVHEQASTIATSVHKDVERTPRVHDSDDESVYTATSFASSASGQRTLRPPPLPAEGENGDPFECKICFTMVIADNERAWRQHVYEDLPPYVCMQESCATAHQPYARRREWQQHERDMHHRVWACPYCKDVLATSELFQAHVVDSHDQKHDDSSMQRMINACAQPLENELTTSQCPLCQKIIVPQKRFFKHLGHHLEELALFSLPSHLHGDESDAGSDGSDASDIPQAAIDLQREIDRVQKQIDSSTLEWADRNLALNELSELKRLKEANNDLTAAAMLRDDGGESGEEESDDDSTEETLRTPPILFNDGVGRKFRFAWKKCKTWEGMELLIKQAFMPVARDFLSEHVHEGHYDLIGSDGQIILPQVWNTMIRPGEEVTMHMWPMPEREERNLNKDVVEAGSHSEIIDRPRLSEYDESEDVEADYMVEAIVAHQLSDPLMHSAELGKQPVMLYKVKWKNWKGSERFTWELNDTLEDRSIVRTYRARVGLPAEENSTDIAESEPAHEKLQRAQEYQQALQGDNSAHSSLLASAPMISPEIQESAPPPLPPPSYVPESPTAPDAGWPWSDDPHSSGFSRAATIKSSADRERKMNSQFDSAREHIEKSKGSKAFSDAPHEESQSEEDDDDPADEPRARDNESAKSEYADKRLKAGQQGGPTSYATMRASVASASLTEADRFLLQLKEDEHLPWKDIAIRFQDEYGNNYRVAALQMRYKRIMAQSRLPDQEEMSDHQEPSYVPALSRDRTRASPRPDADRIHSAENSDYRVLPEHDEDEIEDAGHATESRRVASSYWSLTEQQDFVKYISHFGTDFAAISAQMGTKTLTQIRNHYLRQIQTQSDLETAAREADKRRNFAGDGDTPVAPDPNAKRHYLLPLQSCQPPLSHQINLKYLELETLKHYNIPYEFNSYYPGHVNILREMTPDEAGVLFEHTRKLREERNSRTALSKLGGAGTMDEADDIVFVDEEYNERVARFVRAYTADDRQGVDDVERMDGNTTAFASKEVLKRHVKGSGNASPVIDTSETESEQGTSSEHLGEKKKGEQQPVFPKVHCRYLDVETLQYYGIPFERDRVHPDYFILLRQMDKHETDILFEHTRKLRSAAGLDLNTKDARPLRAEGQRVPLEQGSMLEERELPERRRGSPIEREGEEHATAMLREREPTARRQRDHGLEFRGRTTFEEEPEAAITPETSAGERTRAALPAETLDSPNIEDIAIGDTHTELHQTPSEQEQHPPRHRIHAPEVVYGRSASAERLRQLEGWSIGSNELSQGPSAEDLAMTSQYASERSPTHAPGQDSEPHQHEAPPARQREAIVVPNRTSEAPDSRETSVERITKKVLERLDREGKGHNATSTIDSMHRDQDLDLRGRTSFKDDNVRERSLEQQREAIVVRERTRGSPDSRTSSQERITKKVLERLARAETGDNAHDATSKIESMVPAAVVEGDPTEPSGTPRPVPNRQQVTSTAPRVFGSSGIGGSEAKIAEQETYWDHPTGFARTIPTVSRDAIRAIAAKDRPHHRSPGVGTRNPGDVSVTAPNIVDRRSRSSSRSRHRRNDWESEEYGDVEQEREMRYRVKQAVPTVASGLGGAALAGLYEKNKEALDPKPDGHSDRAYYLDPLGIAYGDRYRRTGAKPDLETAIQHAQEAVDATPDNHPPRVGSQKPPVELSTQDEEDMY
ncbi:hypothetical protein LTR56_009635 [Elasticomyces elasticus]|nr:hypothetical protein LTR56_009635 [Elasticomyces elasticus]KAK3660135.1 hypothetical protein LTR22_008142 [Elasticomyces elasticus]KAK4923440.1 hypothetical protein LTR49_009314 [Elasticomyces elasticus]KAK5752312.1 hypothetical protein LTS12_017613 [Elasticomyces elasticus]